MCTTFGMTISKDLLDYYKWNEGFGKFLKVVPEQEASVRLGSGGNFYIIDVGATRWVEPANGYKAVRLSFNKSIFGSLVRDNVCLTICYKDVAFNVEVPTVIQAEPIWESNKEEKLTDEERYYAENLPAGWSVENWIHQHPNKAFKVDCTPRTKRFFRPEVDRYLPDIKGKHYRLLHPTEPHMLSYKSLASIAGCTNEADGYDFDVLMPKAAGEFISRQMALALNGNWNGLNYSMSYVNGKFERKDEPTDKITRLFDLSRLTAN